MRLLGRMKYVLYAHPNAHRTRKIIREFRVEIITKDVMGVAFGLRTGGLVQLQTAQVDAGHLRLKRHVAKGSHLGGKRVQRGLTRCT